MVADRDKDKQYRARVTAGYKAVYKRMKPGKEEDYCTIIYQLKDWTVKKIREGSPISLSFFDIDINWLQDGLNVVVRYKMLRPGGNDRFLAFGDWRTMEGVDAIVA